MLQTVGWTDRRTTSKQCTPHPNTVCGGYKDTIIDITSDSQMNSNFPYKWSPASLTLTTIFTYSYITRITIKNNAPHLKSPKNQNRRAVLGRPAMKLLGDLKNFSLYKNLFMSEKKCIRFFYSVSVASDMLLSNNLFIVKNCELIQSEHGRTS